MGAPYIYDISRLRVNFYVIAAELGLTAGPSKHHMHCSSPSKQTACSLKDQTSIFDTQRNFLFATASRQGLQHARHPAQWAPKDHSTDTNRLQHSS